MAEDRAICWLEHAGSHFLAALQLHVSPFRNSYRMAIAMDCALANEMMIKAMFRLYGIPFDENNHLTGIAGNAMFKAAVPRKAKPLIHSLGASESFFKPFYGTGAFPDSLTFRQRQNLLSDEMYRKMVRCVVQTRNACYHMFDAKGMGAEVIGLMPIPAFGPHIVLDTEKGNPPDDSSIYWICDSLAHATAAFDLSASSMADKCRTAIVCHCQYSTELILKGALVLECRPHQLRHDLMWVLEQLDRYVVGKEFWDNPHDRNVGFSPHTKSDEQHAVAFFNKYTGPGKYPGKAPDVTESVVEEAMEYLPIAFEYGAERFRNRGFDLEYPNEPHRLPLPKLMDPAVPEPLAEPAPVRQLRIDPAKLKKDNDSGLFR